MAQSQVIEGTGEELIGLLYSQPKERFRLIKLPIEREFRTYEQALTEALYRSPDEIAEARSRVLKASPPPRELPPGNTLEDVVMGRWPSDETDEQIFDALQKLS